MSDAPRLLLVEDEEAVANGLAMLLQRAGYQVTWVASAEAALKTLDKHEFDLVLSDVRMDGMSGLELLAVLRARQPELPVILVTAHGTVEMAVAAMREGAADFLVKPVGGDQLRFVVQKALASTAAARAALPSMSTPQAKGADFMVGRSGALDAARARVRTVAPSPSTVLVLGETGTGKELVARALHALSPRAKAPFVALNCGALPDDLFEAELFGYEKGAFTGAVARKPGRVELAQGGTLLLDEVGELTPAAQAKLLRLLQDKSYMRLGGTEQLKADVRFVAATHRDLKAMVREGRFRDDLYQRLMVIDVTLAPLRERREDIEPLVRHFLATLGAAQGRANAVVTPEALALLHAQQWPGNVRQLEHFIERLLVLAPPGDIDAAFVQAELRRVGIDEAGAAPDVGDAASLEARRRVAERAAVEEALAKARGNRSVAARLLGVSRRTLYNKLEALGLAPA